MSNKFKIIVKSNVNGESYFIIASRNGKTIAVSESYSSKNSAYRTVNSLSDDLNLDVYEEN